MNRAQIAAWKRWISSLPVMHFDSMREIEALPEYSATVPTGVTIGKMWRRHDGSFDHDFIAAGGVPVWLIGRYEEAPAEERVDPRTGERRFVEMAATVFYRPVVRVKAKMEILS